jgi:hypothetical protein
MLLDILIIFIVVTIISFFVSVFTIEDYPVISFAFISLGMVFSILCTYSLWNVEYFYVGYNATEGNTSTYIYGTDVYGDPYSYIFVLIFFIFVILFVKASFNMWNLALEKNNEKKRRW